MLLVLEWGIIIYLGKYLGFGFLVVSGLSFNFLGIKILCLIFEVLDFC